MDAPKPFQRQREVRVFANSHGELFNDEVITGAGVSGRYLRWKWSAVGVVVIPVDNGRVAFVPTYRYPVGMVSLELPRGAADPHESPVDGGLRELKEEAGLLGRTAEHLGTLFADTGLIESGIHVVRADVTATEAVSQAPEDMESVAVPVWLTDDGIHAAVRDGTISCGVTLAALAMWRLR
jgi:ADP-ribose pyrophosphatase YjhB (NUDIX family)